MKRLACIAVIGASLVVAPLPAAGADDGATYAVMGAGNVSCGTWTQERKSQTVLDQIVHLERESWMLGYITALNSWYLPDDRGVVRDLAEGTDNAGLMAWIDNYCAAHPLNALTEAAIHLADELMVKWHAAHPSP